MLREQLGSMNSLLKNHPKNMGKNEPLEKKTALPYKVGKESNLNNPKDMMGKEKNQRRLKT